MGQQPTTSQLFQPLSLQTLVLVAIAIHCALSEDATGKKVTVMFSQDEYWGKFAHPHSYDCIPAAATALLINSTWWAASYPPPPPQWDSSARIRAPQTLSALLSLDSHFDMSVSAPQSPLQPRLGAPLFDCRLCTSLHCRRCSAWMAAPLDRRFSTLVSTPWPGVAPLYNILHSSINISTPLAHPALHIRHSSFPGGAPLFPPNSSYCLSNFILIQCELTSQFQPLRYHKSSQTTFEFNFTHLPGSNHAEIQQPPTASLRRWWIECSCVCRPW